MKKETDILPKLDSEEIDRPMMKGNVDQPPRRLLAGSELWSCNSVEVAAAIVIV